MARAREIPIAANDVYSEAAVTVVRVRTEELSEHSRGVLDLADVERLHDMRVASRRLRAAMEVFGPCFPRSRFKEALREVKRLADALGERRDRDVSIATLESFVAEMPSLDRPGIGSLIESLRAEQLEANERLAGFVDREELATLRRKMERLAREAGVDAR